MATKGKKISEVAEDNKLSQLDGTELVPMAKNGSNAVADVDTIKEYANEGLDDKYVAKEDGKVLSSNDYTDEDKNKVDTLGNTYLPLSGGTISNSEFGSLEIKRSKDTGHSAAIKFSNNARKLGLIGVYDDDNNNLRYPVFYSVSTTEDGEEVYSAHKLLYANGTSSQFLKADGSVDGTAYWSPNNDGSGSGLDADFLDGHHLTDIVRYEYNPTTEISLNDRRVVGGVDIFDYDYQTADKINNTPFGDKISSAGATYTFGSRFTMQLFNVYNGSSLFFRSLYSGNWTSWHQIAFTDSNVASADKLTTKQLTNEDLNEIKDTNFSVYRANGGNSCTNKPNGVNGFSLQCFNTDNNYIAQILYSTVDNAIYKRIFYAHNTSWSSWQQLATTDGAVAKLTTKQLTNEDLNDIKSGELSLYFAYGGNTCANTPFSENIGFQLQVYGQNANYCMQIVNSLLGLQYKRYCSNGTWTSWKKMLTEDDIASLVARVTALENK